MPATAPTTHRATAAMAMPPEAAMRERGEGTGGRRLVVGPCRQPYDITDDNPLASIDRDADPPQPRNFPAARAAIIIVLSGGAGNSE